MKKKKAVKKKAVKKKAVKKKVVKTKDLASLKGKVVQLWCMNYIYSGKLEEISDSEVKLTDASVVYETGPLNEIAFSDAQPARNPIYVRLSSVESYSLV